MGLEISEQIRKRRLELGWSLGDLARRADTSAATLSRYENGWTRFELYTLGKLASALGCELQVALTPTSAAPAKPLSKAGLLKQIRRLFWEHRLREQDLEQYAVWIVERVLEYGQLTDISALQVFYGRQRFLEIVAQTSRLSERTAVFWAHVLKKEGIPCTRRYSRPTAWNY